MKNIEKMPMIQGTSLCQKEIYTGSLKKNTSIECCLPESRFFIGELLVLSIEQQ
jgi:hypothetical protein